MNDDFRQPSRTAERAEADQDASETAAPTAQHAVVVIGAGSAGLATAAALHRLGVGSLVVEAGGQPGHSWTRRHEDLRLNTVRSLSELPGLRLSPRLGRWVAARDYAKYLQSYARYHDLDVHTEWPVRTVSRRRGEWELTSDRGVLRSSHVVVATGLEREPSLPPWPGRERYGRPILHVAEMRATRDLAGQRVLLVGAGNSGIEIAGHLVDHGVEQLWLSVRTPPTILPRSILGVALQSTTVVLERLPEGVRDGLARRMARASIGDLSPWGLRAPDIGPFERLRLNGVTVAVDTGFVSHLRQGRVTVVPPVRELTEGRVTLEDGRQLDVDAVVCATGYRPGLEEMVGHLGILDERGHPVSPQLVQARAPGMWFTGYRASLSGNLRSHGKDGQALASVIAGALPPVARTSA